jgi:glucosylceramidase
MVRSYLGRVSVKYFWAVALFSSLLVYGYLMLGNSSDPQEREAGTQAGESNGSRTAGHESIGNGGVPVIKTYVVDVYQTSQAGDNLALLASLQGGNSLAMPAANGGSLVLTIDAETMYQKYYGFGASFTESSAWNLATIPVAKRKEVLTKLFSPTDGAGFSLTRTHINSSDYSNNHYSYVEEMDEDLSTFSINEDLKGFTGNENKQTQGVKLEDASYDLIPMIREAQDIPGADFKVIASPWSPPSWMKSGETSKMTNGSLQEKYQPIWAEYFSKYLTAYADEGINIWALTIQNEPLHADNARWDSNGWSAIAARDFLRDHLGPRLEMDGHLNTADLESGVRVLLYDHNKSVMNDYVAATFADPEAAKYAWGTGFHWYTNSELDENNWYAAELALLHKTYPERAMIHTESSIDINVNDPIGQYWTTSTDYAGKFIPFTTYAYDIITDLNNWTQGYVEWCIILSNEGKPNPYNNFNSAPVLINPETDEVIYTPLYYLLSHFSKFIRPGAHRIELNSDSDIDGVIYTAAKNPDGTIALVVFNNNESTFDISVSLDGVTFNQQIAAHAMQTLHLRGKE